MAMAKAQNVHRSYKQGDEGETVSMTLLKRWGWHTVNVSKDPEYRKRDIDLLCLRSLDGKFPKCETVECKRDTKGEVTGNFFLETVSNTNKNTPGWAFYTEAQYIFVVQDTLLHVLPGPKLVEWFKDNYSRFKEITNSTKFFDDDGTRYCSKGRLVPRSVFDREVGIIETIDLVAEGIIPARAS